LGVTEDSLKRRVTRSDAFLANGKGQIVAPDEKLTAFLELEWTIRA
jgi:hypothetical protein